MNGNEINTLDAIFCVENHILNIYVNLILKLQAVV